MKDSPNDTQRQEELTDEFAEALAQILADDYLRRRDEEQSNGGEQRNNDQR